jgi:hypothetical protein
MTAGAKPTAGSATITPTAGGQYTYTISCDGAGGTAKQSVALVVPIPAFKTSYENANGYGLSRINFPASLQQFVPDQPLTWGTADFFKTGNIDIFTAKQNYNISIPYSVVTSDVKYQSDFQFWRRDPATGTLTQVGPSYKGCLHPRKGVVADFNNDGWPDVFVACTGYDSSINGRMPGEKSKLLLSDGKGGFTVTDATDIGFFHGATAADVNGDGWVDIVVADFLNPNHSIYVLLNNKDGTFTKDETRIKNVTTRVLFSVELVDVNGDSIPDLIAGGDEENPSWASCVGSAWCSGETAIFYGDGTGNFGNKKTVIPAVAGQGTALTFNVVHSNGQNVVYVGRTSDGMNPNGAYKTRVLQAYNETTGTSSVLLNEVGSWMTWWATITRNGVVGVAPINGLYPDYFL